MLTYHEFSEAFMPHDVNYLNMLQRRPNNYNPQQMRPEDIFQPDTGVEFKALWQTHLRVEYASESLRQRLNSNPNFNAYEAFGCLDINESGVITPSELMRIFESRNLFVGIIQSELLVKKMDKNRSG